MRTVPWEECALKRIALALVALCLAACTTPPAPQPPPSAAAPPRPPVQATPPTPDLGWAAARDLTRDQIRDGLIQLMNGPGTDPAAKLADVVSRLGSKPYGPDALLYAAADLDGDGSQEYVMALPVTDPGRSDLQRGLGAALYVIYRQGDQWQVDRSEPLSDLAELRLMRPALHAVVDLAGTGHPQILWSRPHSIATGRQPTAFFVTTWQPGTFTNLPGEMAISRTAKDPVLMAIDGTDLLLTGDSRYQMFLPTRTDRYRYVDGAFRLIDRRFHDPGDTGYARLWDGLVAEEVGRTADAEQNYRDAADPTRKPHEGTVFVYPVRTRQLTPAEVEAFGRALRTLARFRLGALLQESKRETEAAAVLGPDGGPYAGLLAAMQKAPTRQAGCQAAAAWAEGHPAFLAAFNRGVSDQSWAPNDLCGHVPLAEENLDRGTPPAPAPVAVGPDPCAPNERVQPTLEVWGNWPSKRALAPGTCQFVVDTSPLQIDVRDITAPSEAAARATVQITGAAEEWPADARLFGGESGTWALVYHLNGGAVGQTVQVRVRPGPAAEPLTVTLVRQESPIITVSIAGPDGAFAPLTSGASLPPGPKRLRFRATGGVNLDFLATAFHTEDWFTQLHPDHLTRLADDLVEVAFDNPPPLTVVNLAATGQDGLRTPGQSAHFYIGDSPELWDLPHNKNVY